MEKQKPKRGYFYSFIYAVQGIAHFFQYEQNAKSHGVATLLVIALGFYVNLSHAEWAIVLLCCGLMLCAEALNTAIERVVDLCCPEYHELAKQAKDVAAGAVLVLAIIVAIIGCIIFLPYLMEIVAGW